MYGRQIWTDLCNQTRENQKCAATGFKSERKHMILLRLSNPMGFLMAQLVCSSFTIIYNILFFLMILSGIAKGVDFNLVCLWVFVCLFNPCVLFGFSVFGDFRVTCETLRSLRIRRGNLTDSIAVVVDGGGDGDFRTGSGFKKESALIVR